jgi:RNA polymerase sigma-70 factor (ECF subfamily)
MLMPAKRPEPAAGAMDGPDGRQVGRGSDRAGRWHVFRLSDEEAMLRAQGGDAAAFALIVRRWERPVQRLCARMTGDLHLAQDLTQEAFARVFAARASYRPGGRFSTFLWRIALNACCDERRRRARRREVPFVTDEKGTQAETDPTDQAPAPPALAVEREEVDLVRAAVADLPDHYRAVVVLRHYEGLKFREVAEVLGIPEGTVKSRMAEALDRLAEALAMLRTDATRKPQ